jgi:hypothetical protein
MPRSQDGESEIPCRGVVWAVLKSDRALQVNPNHLVIIGFREAVFNNRIDQSFAQQTPKNWCSRPDSVSKLLIYLFY